MSSEPKPSIVDAIVDTIVGLILVAPLLALLYWFFVAVVFGGGCSQAGGTC